MLINGSVGGFTYVAHMLDCSNYNRHSIVLDSQGNSGAGAVPVAAAFFLLFLREANVPHIPWTDAFTSNWIKEWDALCSRKMDFLSWRHSGAITRATWSFYVPRKPLDKKSRSVSLKKGWEKKREKKESKRRRLGLNYGAPLFLWFREHTARSHGTEGLSWFIVVITISVRRQRFSQHRRLPPT